MNSLDALRIYAGSLRGFQSTRYEIANELDRLADENANSCIWYSMETAPMDGTIICAMARAYFAKEGHPRMIVYRTDRQFPGWFEHDISMPVIPWAWMPREEWPIENAPIENANRKPDASPIKSDIFDSDYARDIMHIGIRSSIENAEANLKKVAIAVNETYRKAAQSTEGLEYHMARGLSLDAARAALNSLETERTRQPVENAEGSKMVCIPAECYSNCDDENCPYTHSSTMVPFARAARQPIENGIHGRVSVQDRKIAHEDGTARRCLSLIGYYAGFTATEMRETAHFLNQLAETMEG